jgi:hypothetical protein
MRLKGFTPFQIWPKEIPTEPPIAPLAICCASAIVAESYS